MAKNIRSSQELKEVIHHIGVGRFFIGYGSHVKDDIICVTHVLSADYLEVVSVTPGSTKRSVRTGSRAVRVSTLRYYYNPWPCLSQEEAIVWLRGRGVAPSRDVALILLDDITVNGDPTDTTMYGGERYYRQGAVEAIPRIVEERKQQQLQAIHARADRRPARDSYTVQPTSNGTTQHSTVTAASESVTPYRLTDSCMNDLAERVARRITPADFKIELREQAMQDIAVRVVEALFDGDGITMLADLIAARINDTTSSTAPQEAHTEEPETEEARNET